MNTTTCIYNFVSDIKKGVSYAVFSPDYEYASHFSLAPSNFEIQAVKSGILAISRPFSGVIDFFYSIYSSFLSTTLFIYRSFKTTGIYFIFQ